MCKHVAAVLYAIGARLDAQPALVFKLRAVDEGELIVGAAKGRTLETTAPVSAKVLEGDDLSLLFGLEMESTPESAAKPEPKAKASEKKAKSAPAKKKPTDKALAASAKKSRTKPLTLTDPVKARSSKARPT
jgi:uncharacterized Zn finger protein